MTGKCPECREEKEITRQGEIRGYCDDCYNSKYTCVICNELMTDAWELYTVPGKGNGHKKCLELKDIGTTE